MATGNASIPGYVSHLGLALNAGWSSYDCDGSYKMGLCMLGGSPEVRRP